LTQTGLSNDSIFVKDIEVSKDSTLQELKEVVGDLIVFEGDCSLLRLRLKCFNGFFGKILRENKKTLKQLQVVDRCSLVVQVMSKPEELSSDTYILFLSSRDSLQREYLNTLELRFTGSTLKDLFDQVGLFVNAGQG